MQKDANITIDEARALVAEQALWPRARDFLWDFAPSIHSSWIEDLESLKIEGSNYQTIKLSNYQTIKHFILSTLGVEPCFYTFPKEDWSRLLLLDGQTLESIIKWLGALVRADELRRVTDGKTVRELKAALPGIYPGVFGFTMYFGRDLRDLRDRRDLKDGRDGKDEAEYVVWVGWAILMSFLASLPEPLVSRFKLKLPKTLSASAVPREAEKPAGNLKSVLAKLLKLKFPEAHSLCC